MCRWLPGCLFGAKAAGSCRDEPGTTRPGIARELIATSRQGPRHPPSTLRPHAGHPHPDPAPWLGCRHVLRHLLGVPGEDKMWIWGHGEATWATGQRLCCAAATGRRPGEALGKGRAGSSSGARDSRSHHGSRCLGVWELNCLSVWARSPPSAPGGWLQAGRAAWVLLPALPLLLGGARRGQGGLRGALRTVPRRGQAGGHPLLAATPSPALRARQAPAPAAAKNTVLQQGSPGRGKLWAAGGRAGLFSEGCGPIPGRSILIQPAQVQQSSPEAPYLGPGGRRGWELNREHCPREEEGRERM